MTVPQAAFEKATIAASQAAAENAWTYVSSSPDLSGVMVDGFVDFYAVTRAALTSVRDFALEHWNDDETIENQNYMLAVADCINRVLKKEDE